MRYIINFIECSCLIDVFDRILLSLVLIPTDQKLCH